MAPYRRNSKFLYFPFLKMSTKWMAPLILPWYETVTLHGADEQHPCWTELPKTVCCAFWHVQKSRRVDGQPAHFPLLSQHPSRYPRRPFPVTLRMCSCSPLTPYILSTNQSFRERNLLPRGICQCCNHREEPESEVTIAVTQQKIPSAMVLKWTTLPRPMGSC